jgi:hypothetical protein
MKCCDEHKSGNEPDKNEEDKNWDDKKHTGHPEHPGHSGCCGGGGGGGSGIMKWVFIGLVIALLILFVRGMM